MANLRVRSTDGSNSDDGSTWALAKADLSGFISAAAAGDTAYVSQVHAQTTASALSLTFPGTTTSPNRIICGNDAADPPTSTATTGAVATTGASNITLQGSAYWRGIALTCGSAAANFANFRINYAGGAFQWYDTCDFILQDSHPSSLIQIGSVAAGDSTKTRFDSCRFKLSNTNSYLSVTGAVQINGGSMVSGTSTPTAGLFVVGTVSKDAFIEVNRFDFSNLASALILVQDPTDTSPGAKPARVTFNRCILPASWSGTLVTGTVEIPGFVAEMRNCQISGGAKVRMWSVQQGGSVRDDTTVVMTGGASDDGTAFSMKAVSVARCGSSNPMECPPIKLYNTTVGSVSYTLEITHSSVGGGTAGALKDDEFWLEAVYPGGFATTRPSNPLAASSDLSSSSVTWSAISSQLKQKVTITFSPDAAGDIIIRPMLAKASVTAYYDPKAV